MAQKFNKINSVKGILELPGDKSISHRAVMFSALAKGRSSIKNLSTSADVTSTIDCFQKLGCEIYEENGELILIGKGFKGLQKYDGYLDAGNSGTTARLISGILGVQDFDSVIIGDSSLSSRPMKRIIEPLSQMGITIESNNGYLPLKFIPNSNLKTINYTLPIPSAQIKSSVILAGIHNNETSTILENISSRNHTEIMLGLDVETIPNGNLIKFSKHNYPEAKEYFVPSDISSSAFFVALALLADEGELIIKNVSLNPTRTGYIDLLKLMGAKMSVDDIRYSSGEKVGNLVINNSNLLNINIPLEIIPNIIDEIPILSIIGVMSEGKFLIHGAGELRKKESDRISALCNNFRSLGLDVEEFDDGFEISGRISNKNVIFESYGDHRIAMAFGIFSLLNEGNFMVNDFDCVKISNPNFINQVKTITG